MNRGWQWSDNTVSRSLHFRVSTIPTELDVGVGGLLNTIKLHLEILGKVSDL